MEHPIDPVSGWIFHPTWISLKLLATSARGYVWSLGGNADKSDIVPMYTTNFDRYSQVTLILFLVLKLRLSCIPLIIQVYQSSSAPILCNPSIQVHWKWLARPHVVNHPVFQACYLPLSNVFADFPDKKNAFSCEDFGDRHQSESVLSFSPPQLHGRRSYSRLAGSLGKRKGSIGNERKQEKIK